MCWLFFCRSIKEIGVILSLWIIAVLYVSAQNYLVPLFDVFVFDSTGIIPLRDGIIEQQNKLDFSKL